MSKPNVFLARFTYGRTECSDLGQWLAHEVAASENDERIGDVLHAAIDVCPTPVARNRAVALARQHKCQYLLMVDADTRPATGFLGFAVRFLEAQMRPSVVGSPYVSGPPGETVQVFHWDQAESGIGDAGGARLLHINRRIAAAAEGTERVACLGTGAICFDVRAFEAVSSPYFRYELNDDETEVLSTEDVYLLRDMALAGVPLFVSWDHWATHYKLKACDKPELLELAKAGRRLAALVKEGS